ncbi:MAG: FAD-binding oxidoreductase [Candidatus Kapabacteria bacterium]|nr:FAD-binding oxidoreductase [Ignavibacteriota bacterium]MCW5885745.1 FAD-binding oxidoreductase [Candidatus Kapabacteria bacterium]
MTLKFKTDPDTIYPYTYDSSNLKGSAELLFIPENSDELNNALLYCYNEEIKITISGAGTGITGARVPNGGAVISMEKFKNINLLDNNRVQVGSSVTLDELDKFLAEHNLFLPPNPTEINASIGGNTANNASGARTFKYGPIRRWITGLKVVLPNGDRIKLKRGEIFAENYKLSIPTKNGSIYSVNLPTYTMPDVKNASGYFTGSNIDAIDLFIGSEGTLCVFEEIELEVLPRPENIIGGIVFFDDNYRLLDFVTELRSLSRLNFAISIKKNDNLCARLIEYFDRKSLDLLSPKYPEIPSESIGAIWFEQEYYLDYEEVLMTKWYEFISKFTTLADETWFAVSDKDHLKLKEFRHELPLQVYENLANNSQKKVGLDSAVPDGDFPILYNHYLDQFADIDLEYVVFGHIGNCHLHANIFCRNDEEYAFARKLYDESIDLALSFGGTVSAEHGIGKLKKPYLIKMLGQNAIDEMIEVKKVFDDKLLLNIGTMFDLQTL